MLVCYPNHVAKAIVIGVRGHQLMEKFIDIAKIVGN